MTEKWFIEDIKHQMQHRQKVVLLDSHGVFSFVLPILEKNCMNKFKKQGIIERISPNKGSHWKIN